MENNKLLNFKNYLEDKKLSKISVKNYLSDIRHFIYWSAKNKILVLEKSVFEKYKQCLLNNNKPIKTINRYLASLRKYGRFLKEENLIQQNPALGLKNINPTLHRSGAGQVKPRTKIKFAGSTELIDNFKAYLNKEKIKPATVKNYISDVNQFLNWMEKKVN
ncbi:hypothetical protein A3J78_00625 [Candidatus Beckwithbacteria bacterium RBG_13_35_6]|uniref:Core-binding (CB) domain-containing protein n=1 Tax=Candidatus Beckwithbacteria bacterium RBG_13_35_6 TaxID=1797456 RepID=A0A1F5DGG9_9BACT|nr:MAG: hypothetical protein A3J78_00625 [Candidatus Beckwithbacteria bacterium RBG_13_35_6]